MRRHHAKLYANELIYSTMREISVALADGNFGAVTMRQGLRCSANPWRAPSICIDQILDAPAN